MYLIQILLPLSTNAGRPLKKKLYEAVRTTLTERFDGVTIYSRSPAEGIWTQGTETSLDQIVVYEVMTTEIDSLWWKNYRQELEQCFEQQSIIIRAHTIQLL